DDVNGTHLAMLHRLEHLAEVIATLGRNGRIPRALEWRPLRRVFEVLETREPVRYRAHVAAALHVVLAAERIEPAAIAADLAGEEGEVDECEHVVDRVVVLGDSEGP